MGAALGICSETEDCCSKYKGRTCSQDDETGRNDYCSKTFPCPATSCNQGKFRETPTSNCGEYKPGCGINEYKEFAEDSRCKSINTREYISKGTVVERFSNYRKGHTDNMCPYKIIRIILFLLFMYILFRLIKSRK